MTKKLLEQVRRQLITDRKKHWMLPQWVAEEMFKHIDDLEKELQLIKNINEELNNTDWMKKYKEVDNLYEVLQIHFRKSRDIEGEIISDKNKIIEELNSKIESLEISMETIYSNIQTGVFKE